MRLNEIIRLLEISGEGTKGKVLDFFKSKDKEEFKELIKDLQEVVENYEL